MRKRTTQVQIQNQYLPKYMTVPEAAAECGIGQTAVRKFAKASGSFRKFGRSARIEREIFLNYLEKIGAPT